MGTDFRYSDTKFIYLSLLLVYCSLGGRHCQEESAAQDIIRSKARSSEALISAKLRTSTYTSKFLEQQRCRLWVLLNAMPRLAMLPVLYCARLPPFGHLPTWLV